jgi:hypothetical protein
MARRTRVVTISAENRDKGKRFLLTEMAADQGERWAIRMLLAIANAGGKLPEGALDAGMSGLAATMQSSIVVGLRAIAGVRFEDAETLLAEMMDCVQYQPNTPNVPAQSLIAGSNSQIEEVSTRLTLRWEVLQLHLNFSLADALSTTATPPVPPVPAA